MAALNHFTPQGNTKFVGNIFAKDIHSYSNDSSTPIAHIENGTWQFYINPEEITLGSEDNQQYFIAYCDIATGKIPNKLLPEIITGNVNPSTLLNDDSTLFDLTGSATPGKFEYFGVLETICNIPVFRIPKAENYSKYRLDIEISEYCSFSFNLTLSGNSLQKIERVSKELFSIAGSTLDVSDITFNGTYFSVKLNNDIANTAIYIRTKVLRGNIEEIKLEEVIVRYCTVNADGSYNTNTNLVQELYLDGPDDALTLAFDTLEDISSLKTTFRDIVIENRNAGTNNLTYYKIYSIAEDEENNTLTFHGPLSPEEIAESTAKCEMNQTTIPIINKTTGIYYDMYLMGANDEEYLEFVRR